MSPGQGKEPSTTTTLAKGRPVLSASVGWCGGRYTRGPIAAWEVRLPAFELAIVMPPMQFGPDGRTARAVIRSMGAARRGDPHKADAAMPTSVGVGCAVEFDAVSSRFGVGL